jgi:hypothetical protein
MGFRSRVCECIGTRNKKPVSLPEPHTSVSQKSSRKPSLKREKRESSKTSEATLLVPPPSIGGVPSMGSRRPSGPAPRHSDEHLLSQPVSCKSSVTSIASRKSSLKRLEPRRTGRHEALRDSYSDHSCFSGSDGNVTMWRSANVSSSAYDANVLALIEKENTRDSNRAQRKAFSNLRAGSFKGHAPNVAREVTTKVPTDEGSMQDNYNINDVHQGIGLNNRDLAKLRMALQDLQSQQGWTDSSISDASSNLAPDASPSRLVQLSDSSLDERRRKNKHNLLSRDRASSSTMVTESRSGKIINSPTAFRNEQLIFRRTQGMLDSESASEDDSDIDADGLSSTSTSQEFVYAFFQIRSSKHQFVSKFGIRIRIHPTIGENNSGSPCYPSPVLRVRRTSPGPYAT